MRNLTQVLFRLLVPMLLVPFGFRVVLAQAAQRPPDSEPLR
jgi:hypothetical protein